MKKLLFTSFLMLICLYSFAQQLIETVPLKFINNLIFVEVTVNNQDKPLNFLFDTGAGITVIDTKIATEFSLKINGEAKINTSSKSLLSKESSSNILTIGKKAILDSINLIVMDLNHLSQYLNTNVDGVIGYDLLNTYVTETNIDAKEFRIYNASNYIYKGNFKPLEITTLESNLFGIVIEVTPKKNQNPIKLNFQIDTGASHTLNFHNKTVRENNLLNENKKKKFKKGFGADSTIVTNIQSKIKAISFGGKSWKNVPAIFEIDSIQKRENSLADGLIGQQLLIDFNIIYDLSKRLVYLEKRK